MSGSADLSGYRAGCQVVAIQKVGIVADVEVKPEVHCGEITVSCLPTRVVPCDHEEERTERVVTSGTCKVRIKQDLVVMVPLTFEAEALCSVEGIHCGPMLVRGDEDEVSDSDFSAPHERHRHTHDDSSDGESD